MKKLFSIMYKINALLYFVFNRKNKADMVWHYEVKGKWENGKYSSVVTKVLMTMDDSVAITIAKF